MLLRPRNVQFVFFLSAWSRQVFVSCCQCAETTGVCAAPRWYTADTDSPSRSIITSLRSHSQLCSLYTLPVGWVCVLFICLCLLCVTLSAHWHEFCLTWYANQKTWGRVVLIAWWLFELWFCVACVCVKKSVRMRVCPKAFRIRMWNSRSAFQRWRPVGSCHSCWHTHTYTHTHTHRHAQTHICIYTHTSLCEFAVAQINIIKSFVVVEVDKITELFNTNNITGQINLCVRQFVCKCLFVRVCKCHCGPRQ